MKARMRSGKPGNGTGADRRRKILVVDNECVIADTIAAILNGSGCSAIAAYSAEQALQVIAAGVPDLLITDVSMPGMNGVELAINVRQHFPECKVLLFSGHASSSHIIEEAREKGYDFELLSKPIHPRDLLERVKSAT